MCRVPLRVRNLEPNGEQKKNFPALHFIAAMDDVPRGSQVITRPASLVKIKSAPTHVSAAAGT
jgi:hypothetical protein